MNATDSKHKHIPSTVLAIVAMHPRIELSEVAVCFREYPRLLIVDALNKLWASGHIACHSGQYTLTLKGQAVVDGWPKGSTPMNPIVVEGASAGVCPPAPDRLHTNFDQARASRRSIRIGTDTPSAGLFTISIGEFRQIVLNEHEFAAFYSCLTTVRLGGIEARWEEQDYRS